MGWFEDRDKWASLQTLVVQQSERIEGAKTSCDVRYFITSQPADVVRDERSGSDD